MNKKIVDIKQVPKIQKVGVYAIHNKKNNKYYIGSSVNIYTRMKQQVFKINSNIGLNKKMELDIINNNYDFEFLAVKTFEDGEITNYNLRELETDFMKKYNSIQNGYNCNFAWTNYKSRDTLICPIEENGKKVLRYEQINVLLRKGTYSDIYNLTKETPTKFIQRVVENEIQRLKAK